MNITALWLRSNAAGEVEVLAEVYGVWKVAIPPQKCSLGPISHMTETASLKNAPVHPINIWRTEEERG